MDTGLIAPIADHLVLLVPVEEGLVLRDYPEADYRTYIVLDATTGQNALSQVEIFKEAIDVDGIVLTKLDGTAKGGVVIAICNEMEVPVLFVGVGEGKEDLLPFDASEFISAIVP